MVLLGNFIMSFLWILLFITILLIEPSGGNISFPNQALQAEPGSSQRSPELFQNLNRTNLFSGQSLAHKLPSKIAHPSVSLDSISPNLFMQLVAGTGTAGYAGDAGQATSAQIAAYIPFVDTIGNIYLPDNQNSRIRKIDTTGIITAFGGSGTAANTGISGAIGSVSFFYPYSIVGDAAGTALYIADRWFVWKYVFNTNIVTVYAHSTSLGQGFSGDNGLATSAQLYIPTGIWFTTSNTLYISDHGNHRIRRVLSNGIITTVAGSGCSSACTGSFSGENVLATTATLKNPRSVYVDTYGILFIADFGNNLIRVVGGDNKISTFAGTGGETPFSGDNIASTSATVFNPFDVKGDSLGNIYIADTNCIISVVNRVDGIISKLFGSPTPVICGISPGTSPRTSLLGNPTGIWVDSLSTVYFSSYTMVHRSLMVSAPTSQPTKQPSSQPSSQPSRRPSTQPTGQPSSRISSNVFMQLVAGTGTSGFSGENGPATLAQMRAIIPFVDSSGNMYIPDYTNRVIRKIGHSSGIITRFGGTGNGASNSAVGGTITSIDFYDMYSIVGDGAGTFLYISDQYFVWKYSFATNSAFVYAHSPSAGPGFSGNGGEASSAQLNHPTGLWLTTSGVLYIADSVNNQIRKVSSVGIISSVAGGGAGGDNNLATSASLNYPRGVYVDTNGQLFVADSANNRIRLVDTNNIITTFAGTGTASPFNGNNLPKLSANIKGAWDVKGDSLGTIYIADFDNCIIRMVVGGIISTLFGTPTSCTGFSSGITPRSSVIGGPWGIWLDTFGNTLYFSDYGSIHRSVDLSPTTQPSGRPTRQPTSQPSRQPSSCPSSQPSRQPTSQPINQPSAQPTSQPSKQPSGLPTGQPSRQPTRQPTGQPSSRPSPEGVSPNLFLQLVGGTGTAGYSGDNGPATSAQMRPVFPWVDISGNIYIPDYANYRIRRVSSAGIISTFGGTGSTSIAGTSGPIGSVNFRYPHSITGDTAETVLYISDELFVWKYVFATNIATVIAHSGAAGFSGDGGPASSAQLSDPCGLWLTTSYDLYIADHKNHRIRRVSSEIITTVVGSGCSNGCVGSYSGDNGPALSAALKNPLGICMNTNGKLFIADFGNNRIRLVDTNNIITTFAGSGTTSPFNGDNLPSLVSNLNNPRDVKGDSAGNIYISDYNNCIVRRVDIYGIISIFFGNTGSCGFTSGISPRSSSITGPQGLWIDSASVVYVSDDTSIHRSVDLSPTSQPSRQPTRQPSGRPSSQPSARPSSAGISPNLFMKLMVGTNTTGYSGDSGPATSARISTYIPYVDTNGNIYLPDHPSSRIRKINTAGIISLFGGTTTAATGVTALIQNAQFAYPYCIVGDSVSTALYISDMLFVWKYVFSTNIVSVIAHSASLSQGFSGDNGAASLAQLYTPLGIWLTTSNVLYIVDHLNHRIRKVSSPGGIITTVIGSGCSSNCVGGSSGDNGPATSATLDHPRGIFVDSMGKQFLTESQYNNRVRMVDINNIITTFAGSGTASPFNGDNLPKLSANIKGGWDVKGDSLGNIYIADLSNCIIRVVDSHEIISTLFGTPGVCGFTTSPSGLTLPRSSKINTAVGIWVDSLSNIYFSDLNSIHRGTLVSSPTSQPSMQPSAQPFSVPTRQPTNQPSNQPTRQPTKQPTTQPVALPTGQPSLQPTNHPTRQPTKQPTTQPVALPTGQPSLQPTTHPTRQPTGQPTTQPVALPTGQPTLQPTTHPTNVHSAFSASFNFFMQIVVGSNSSGYSGDNGPATMAKIKATFPWVDTAGNLFIPDNSNSRIRKVTPEGIITTFGGTGIVSFSGGQGPINSFSLNNVWSIVGDTAGTALYISDQRYVFKYVFSTNIITSLAHPSGVAPGFGGDNGPASSALLNNPLGLWLTTSGDLYFADNNNHRIRKVSSTGIITSVAGNGGSGGFSGDNGPATSADLRFPRGVFMDTIGRLFITDYSNHRIRLVSNNNIITTFAGTGTANPFNGDNRLASTANINFPHDVKGDSAGNIYISSYGSCVVQRVDSSGTIVVVFGTPGSCGFSPGISSGNSVINPLYGLWVDTLSILYFSDYNSIHRGFIVADPSSQPSGLPTGQPSSRPSVMVSVTIPDNLLMSVVAGTGTAGYSNEGGPATSARISAYYPWVDFSGNIYLPNDVSNRIRKIDSLGIINLLGGTGVGATTGKNGPIGSTSFYSPFCIVGDQARTVLYFTDQYFVWKYEFSTNNVTVLAHSPGLVAGFSGDNGPASLAQLNNPNVLWITTAGDLYIADHGNHRIRKVLNGIITTVVGSSTGGYSGDNGPAIAATIRYPRGIFVDTNGRLFIADLGNNRIRVVDISNNIITTFAGTGTAAPFTGNNIPATSTNLNIPWDVKGDSIGNIYITDSGNCIIRMVDSRRLIFTVFGTLGSCGFTPGDSSRTSAMNFPAGLWVDSLSNLYFSDVSSLRRGVLAMSPSSQPSGQPSRQPTNQPSRPSGQPTNQPTNQPSGQPTSHPTKTSSPSFPFTNNLFMKLVAGVAAGGDTGENGPATAAQIRSYFPWVDSSGNIYLPGDSARKIRRVTCSDGTITTFAGTGVESKAGISGPVGSLNLNYPFAIVGDTAGTVLYFTDQWYIWKYLFSTNIAAVYAQSTSVTHGFDGDGGPASSAKLNNPLGLWLTTDGVLYVSDNNNHRIRKISSSEIITTVAGNGGSGGFSGENGPAISAALNFPRGLFMDTNGRLFIADYSNHRIRLVNNNNIITTFAGTGTANPFNGDNRLASTANINLPNDVKGDSAGNIYISSWGACVVHRVDNNGIISVVFGSNPGSCGYSPGISSRSAPLNPLFGLWVDSLATVYFSDYNSVHKSMVVSSPTSQPSVQPSLQPSSRPSMPSGQPSSQPSRQPVGNPSSRPTSQPSHRPSSQPTHLPSSQPTGQPAINPSAQPTNQPIACPSSQPTHLPSSQPTRRPTGQPTSQPSVQPMGRPSSQPSSCPSSQPYSLPSSRPSSQPTHRPSFQPTSRPSRQPSSRPSSLPTAQPTIQPTGNPTTQPSSRPTVQASRTPTRQPTANPSGQPSSVSSVNPSEIPPNQPTSQPTASPTTFSPSSPPTAQPSTQPSIRPSGTPSSRPSTQASTHPTNYATHPASSSPTVQLSSQPTNRPSGQPIVAPTGQPASVPTTVPTEQPTSFPSPIPSCQPSSKPTVSSQPTTVSREPTSFHPSSIPSSQPIVVPSAGPSLFPSSRPTSRPTNEPSAEPSVVPTETPVGGPTSQPSVVPSIVPTVSPISLPSREPQSEPSLSPIVSPSGKPLGIPSSVPSRLPTLHPSLQPLSSPSGQPSCRPSKRPTAHPSRQPVSRPSGQPSRQPSAHPTVRLSRKPTVASPPSFSQQPSTTAVPTFSPTATFSVLNTASTPPEFKGFILPLNNFIQTSESSLVNQNIDFQPQTTTTLGSSFIVFGRKKKYSDFSFGDSKTDAYSYYTKLNNNNGQQQGGMMIADKTSRSVTVLGDINGDSLPDIILGNPLTSTCFVYLGKERNRFVNLPVSFVITTGEENSGNDFFGWATAALGDCNNDGQNDFMISAIYSNTVYVIYGMKSSFPPNNNNLIIESNFNGFTIIGRATDINFGMSISSAGDFDNDGFRDYLISSMSGSSSLSSQNVIYIIFGNHSTRAGDVFSIDQLPLSGYYKIIAPKSSFAGFSLASLGDINEDGFDDVVIGSIPYQGGYTSQRSYVLYGRRSSSFLLSKNNLLVTEMREGEDGFTITGGGFAVGGPGDVNHDGLNDILIVDYRQWQGKGNSFLLFYPGNDSHITSPPTFRPSSLPSNHPSSSLTSHPSLTIIVESPTNRPSSSSPSLTRVMGTFPPFLSATLPPTTKAPQTTKPTRIPSVMPSTRFPTTRMPLTVSPTVTGKPSFRPTRCPSLIPSRTPTAKPSVSPTFRPSRSPSLFPSSYPTFPSSVSVPFSTIAIANNGSYSITSSEEEIGGTTGVSNKEIIISATGNIVLRNEGNENNNGNRDIHIYRILPRENIITILDFRTKQDILDLIPFSDSFTSLKDLPFRSHPLTFFLSEKQRIILANHEEMDLTEENFYFSTSSPTESFSEPRTAVRTDSSLIISLVILVVCAMVVLLLVCLPSFQKKKEENDEDELSNYLSGNMNDIEDDTNQEEQGAKKNSDDGKMSKGTEKVGEYNEQEEDDEENEEGEENDDSLSLDTDDDDEEDEEDDSTADFLLDSDEDDIDDLFFGENEEQEEPHSNNNDLVSEEERIGRTLEHGASISPQDDNDGSSELEDELEAEVHEESAANNSYCSPGVQSNYQDYYPRLPNSPTLANSPAFSCYPNNDNNQWMNYRNDNIGFTNYDTNYNNYNYYDNNNININDNNNYNNYNAPSFCPSSDHQRMPPYQTTSSAATATNYFTPTTPNDVSYDYPFLFRFLFSNLFANSSFFARFEHRISIYTIFLLLLEIGIISKKKKAVLKRKSSSLVAGPNSSLQSLAK
jgi:sugar lactone lactonase YvrE